MATLNDIFEQLKAMQESLDDLLKPKEKPAAVEEWEDVTKTFQEHHLAFAPCISKYDGYSIKKIDGMHYGPAFVIERRRT